MRKNNIKQLLRQTSNSGFSDDVQDIDPLFQQYEKNLYATHKVPKVKINQPRFW